MVPSPLTAVSPLTLPLEADAPSEAPADDAAAAADEDGDEEDEATAPANGRARMSETHTAVLSTHGREHRIREQARKAARRSRVGVPMPILAHAHLVADEPTAHGAAASGELGLVGGLDGEGKGEGLALVRAERDALEQARGLGRLDGEDLFKALQGLLGREQQRLRARRGGGVGGRRRRRGKRRGTGTVY